MCSPVQYTGTISTRWRDYVDIVQVGRNYQLDHDELAEAVTAVAKYRSVWSARSGDPVFVAAANTPR